LTSAQPGGVLIDLGQSPVAPPAQKLGEILVAQGAMLPEQVEQVIAQQNKSFGEIAVDTGLTTSQAVAEAVQEQERQQRLAGISKSDQAQRATIRVPAQKLDTLVGLVGELVTVQARLSQIATLLSAEEEEPVTIPPAKIIATAEELERLTSALRDTTMSVRMTPIGSAFNRFVRIVRDLSHELGKEIELVTSGEETELDKTVIEKLGDPLIHLIRNSVDHGIEPPAERIRAGKPSQGTIRLAAEHSGAHVLIRIADDGAGIDLTAVRQKAVEMGLLDPTSQLTDHNLCQFIFAPGFSTAKRVTNVSGRGVGMDVVKRNIEELRGTVDIDSVRGQGTAITLKLPLTLAIIDGLLVKIGDDYFVIPQAVVEECIELDSGDMVHAHGNATVEVRGSLVPYVRLRDFFAIPGDRPEIEQVVIAEVGRQRLGLVIDEVIGEHQTVIKSMGQIFRQVEGISGATILGDGTVALIIDPVRMVQLVEREVRGTTEKTKRSSPANFSQN